jgi:hypothetical protein
MKLETISQKTKQEANLGEDREVEDPISSLEVQLLPEDDHGLAGALDGELLVLVPGDDGVGHVGVGRVRHVPGKEDFIFTLEEGRGVGAVF